jgi:hypothetical protein
LVVEIPSSLSLYIHHHDVMIGGDESWGWYLGLRDWIGDRPGL